MAYMSQEKKKMLAPKIKSVLKKYGVQGTISVRHHSTLVVTLRKGKLALEDGNLNLYWLEDHYEGDVLNFLKELKNAMNDGNHDNSDLQTDYFDVGWYSDVKVGADGKPYVHLG